MFNVTLFTFVFAVNLDTVLESIDANHLANTTGSACISYAAFNELYPNYYGRSELQLLKVECLFDITRVPSVRVIANASIAKSKTQREDAEFAEKKRKKVSYFLTNLGDDVMM